MPLQSPSNGRWSRLRTERLLQVVVVFVLFVAILSWMRPKNVSGLTPDAFWNTKMSWSACADLVVAGDSRAYLGISPAALQEVLPGRRILNFGMDDAGLSGSYLRAAAAVLDPSSAHRAIILGIAPHTLSPEAGGIFLRKVGRRKSAPRFGRMFRGLKSVSLYNLTEPIALNQAWALVLAPNRMTRHQREYRPDGWLASDLTPKEPENGFEVARGWYHENRVSDAIIDSLCAQVRRWRAQGIQVYGVQPPTTTEMIAFETRLSGFDQPSFIRKFSEAGGTWLDLPVVGYSTYDSSHLDRNGAIAFSRDLAFALRGRWE